MSDRSNLTYAGILFLYGCLHLYKGRDGKMTAEGPISPPLESWYFLTVDFWPTCADLRSEHMRFFTFQFVHGESRDNPKEIEVSIKAANVSIHCRWLHTHRREHSRGVDVWYGTADPM